MLIIYAYAYNLQIYADAYSPVLADKATDLIGALAASTVKPTRTPIIIDGWEIDFWGGNRRSLEAANARSASALAHTGA